MLENRISDRFTWYLSQDLNSRLDFALHPNLNSKLHVLGLPIKRESDPHMRRSVREFNSNNKIYLFLSIQTFRISGRFIIEKKTN